MLGGKMMYRQPVSWKKVCDQAFSATSIILLLAIIGLLVIGIKVNIWGILMTIGGIIGTMFFLFNY